MDRLWAPWRIKYLKAKKSKKCIFCKSLKSRYKNYVVFKSRYSFAILNIFPYNNGHLMVSPIRHIRELSQLSSVEILDLFRTLDNTKKMLDKVLNPDGYNIGLNTSASAGAGEARHLHIHIVPRWKGDANFITTLYDTRIMSQSLDELYNRLKKYVKSRTD
ncbi:MAG: HIT family hydrolase [Candidatus Omnitrophica bacterium CG23_combo_of_CG06-09_8_20_14_all_40_11]|nr:MAG: HIT family hydrolase [Candidatus Omnitrophica bacterium CG23_combo_of_CG06-09_8_20_14_all_40_11]